MQAGRESDGEPGLLIHRSLMLKSLLTLSNYFNEWTVSVSFRGTALIEPARSAFHSWTMILVVWNEFVMRLGI